MAADDSGDFDVVEELRESYQKVGALRSVIKTQFGVAAGNTRLKAVSEWPIEKREVKTYYEHLRISASDNIHGRKEPRWWTDTLAKAAQWLIENEHLVPGEITGRLAKDFGLSRRTITLYLPQEFKEPQKVEAGRVGGSTTAAGAASRAAGSGSVDEKELESRLSRLGLKRLRSGAYADGMGLTLTEEMARRMYPQVFDPMASIEKVAKQPAEEPTPAIAAPEVYPKAVSPTMPKFISKGDTLAENLLQELLSPKFISGLDVQFSYSIVEDGVFRCSTCRREWDDPAPEMPILCPRCKTDTGQPPKSYILDALVDGWLAIKVEGEEPSSKGRMKRDVYLRSESYRVLHLPRKMVTDYPEVVVDVVTILHEPDPSAQAASSVSAAVPAPTEDSPSASEGGASEPTLVTTASQAEASSAAPLVSLPLPAAVSTTIEADESSAPSAAVTEMPVRRLYSFECTPPRGKDRIIHEIYASSPDRAWEVHREKSPRHHESKLVEFPDVK